MNNSGTFYSGYSRDGSAKDAAHSPASFRKAFRAHLPHPARWARSGRSTRDCAAGSPELRSGDLPANAFPQCASSGAAGERQPESAGNAAQNYYPGASYVDVEGGDIYDERLTDTAPWEGLERLFAAAHSRGKPFSVPSGA